MHKKLTAITSLVVIMLFTENVNAQSSLVMNIDIPFQYYIGYNHTLNEKINVEGGFGFVVPPFNKWVFTVLPIPVDKDPNRDFARESADWGYVLNIGGNYAINEKWFAGLFAEYAVLKGSSSVKKVSESGFKRDVEKILEDNMIDPALLPIIVSLSSDRAEFESKIYQIGLQFGRTFQLANPKLKIKTSLALARTISAETKLTSFEYKAIPLIPNSDEIYQLIEEEMTNILEDDTDEVFLDYGYITTLRIGFVYTFGKDN